MTSKKSRFNIEQYEAPGTLYHGDMAQLRLVGWVVAEPQVREVRVKLSDSDIIIGRCHIPRPDVLEAYEGFTDELCGFELTSDLSFLAPGVYKVEWLAPESSLSAIIGDIHVLPRCDFELERCFVPDLVSRDRAFPISVQGVLRSSCPLQKVEVVWNTQKTSIVPDVVEEYVGGEGLLSYQVSIFDEVSISDGSDHGVIELVFYTQDKEAYRWSRRNLIRPVDALPCSLSVKEIGAYDPKTGLVSVYFRGMVCVEGDGAFLVLMREGELLLEEQLGSLPTEQSIKSFDFSRDLATIPPGTWDFTLALGWPGRDALRALRRWRHQVQMIEPRLVVEYFDVRLPEAGRSGYLIGIVGWLENHCAVDGLLLKVGEEKPVRIVLDQLRRDVAEHLGQKLVRKQGFHVDIHQDIPPGEYTVQVLFSQEGRLEVLWEKASLFEERSSPEVIVESPQLADFADGGSCEFWSSIRVEGDIDSRFDDVVATLWVDGEEADRQSLRAESRFALRHTPEISGCYQVRVAIKSGESLLYDSGSNYVLFKKFEVPGYAVAVVERFVRRFDIGDAFGSSPLEDLTRALLDRDREVVSDYLSMLREIDSALGVSAQQRAKSKPVFSVSKGLVRNGCVQQNRSLNVLFVCWEIPCPRHGGGVWLTNILKRLTEKHEITIVHSYGVDEEDWLVEVRQCAARVISVPRLSKTKFCPEDSTMLSHIYDDYLPLLQSVVDMEVETGYYDIVNYDYSKLYAHSASANVPQVLVVHEERFSTGLASGSRERDLGFAAGVGRLDGLLKDFYFSAVRIPRKFRQVVALTEEDAGVLGEFQRVAEVQVNRIGVDIGTLRRPADRSVGRDVGSPSLVFLGNYRHPPNVAAVRFFAEEVMPEILRRCPQARFNVVGSHVPKELELDFQASENVVFTGFVEDFRPFLWDASAFVAPIFLGAGMRVKILEAMACGVPVVGTALSMHGIEATDGEHYFQAETEAQFTEVSIRCIEDPEEAMRVGRQGAELIARKYSYEISAREREAIWYRTIENWEDRFGGESLGPIDLEGKSRRSKEI